MSTVYVLRTVDAHRFAYGGFRWPESGPVECPDWDPAPTCGHGLHGLLRGEGDGALLDWEPDAIWQVVDVDERSIVDLKGKVKYPRGVVVYSGTREQATALVKQRHPDALVVGGTVTAGDRGAAVAGYRGVAIVGDYGNAFAGYRGAATAGVGGTATVDVGGTAAAGAGGTIGLGWWDGTRYRVAIGRIGEGELRPGVRYRCALGRIVEAAR